MQINTSSHSMLHALGTLVVFLATSLFSALGYHQKTPITSADQLPRRTVQLGGSVTEILGDRARLDELARELLANLQADLERFDITDPSTLANYHATIGILHAVLGEPEKAAVRVPEMRALESKPAARLTTGLWTSSTKPFPSLSRPSTVSPGFTKR